jgi:hypothetical protein
MPALQHWFAGGALAAFLALLTAVSTLGYAWYRAALTEQESAISKASSAAQKLKGDRAREALQRFYVEVGPIINRQLPKDISEEDFANYVLEADKWVTSTASWINENMGVAARERFLDRTGMNAVSFTAAVNNQHNSILTNLTRLRQNLSLLIESSAWEK